MLELQLYDNWNVVKKALQQKDRVKFFKEGQIWWCSIGQNLGSESYGKGKTFTRPVLVFKKLSAETFLGLPLTTKLKVGTWYVAIKHQGKDVTILFHQARIFDKKRLVDSLGEVDGSDFVKIKTGFACLYCS